MPEYVARRLRRTVGRCGPYVVRGSTPVLSFGNAAQAVVATIGINPSLREFLDTNGTELTGDARRFETLASLGTHDLATAPSAVLSRVFDACNGYFSANPYRSWFDQLEPILNHAGASYYDGSACHLDLVQWATTPVWSKLPKLAREDLMRQDTEFFREQLAANKYRLLLINGNGALKRFEAVMGVPVKAVGRITGISAESRLLEGKLPQGATVVAWSVNLQSSFGVCKQLRSRLADAVGELCENHA